MTYLGIDIGGTRLKAGLVDQNGRILRTELATSPASRETLQAMLPPLVRRLLAGETPAAAGFGCKGIIDPASTEVRTMPGVWGFLTGLRLASLLDGLLPPDTPITADNDAKAALAGEAAWGAAKGRRDVLLLTLGTGIGGAILSNGQLVRGAADAAGHLGHICADPDGPLCICGNHGCLEAIFSARAIEAAAWSAMHQGCLSPMTTILRATPETLSTRFVFEQAALGDSLAQGILHSRIRVLGACLAGLLHALDPEIVVLSGSIADAGPALFEPLQKEVDWRVHGLLKRSVPLVPSGVQDTSGIAGAAALAFRLPPPPGSH